ncbi:MAG: hypothetical protein FJX78_03550 [Armatimonadetes bacterium]|nr:hypothetical protein [Armatimonadota bacterium]
MSNWRTALRFTWILIAAVSAAGCAPRPAALTEYKNEPIGVALRHPEGWKPLTSADGNWVQIVPATSATGEPDASRHAEFISVRVVRGKPATADDTLRREAFTILPFHGVAKFQRAPAEGVRYRFEGTGTAAAAQWAGVGLLVVETERLVHIVCAKPVEKWREGQKQCDDVIASVSMRSP